MNKKQFLLLTTFVALSFMSYAQPKFPGILKRFHMGYSFVSANADYETKNYFFSAQDPELGIDTIYKGNIGTSAAFGATFGTYFPLKQLGQKSKLCLGVDFVYNVMTWGSATQPFGNFGITAQMGLPVGLDIKIGADAMTDKNIRFCTTFGAGVHPSYAVTAWDYDVDLSPNLNVNPYVKAEVGIFAGICMKVRALYSIGSMTYIDYSKGNKYDPITETTTDSGSKLIGKSNLTVSLLIMPFSWGWPRSEWWNTY